MIETILPVKVTAVEAFADVPEGGLFPEEAALITRAVPKRRREFTTVRDCARRALGTLGVPPAPLLPDPKGAPRWPEGIVGSMTHCQGYRAAAVAPRDALRSLGIDAEPHGPLKEGVLEAVTVPGERDRHTALVRTHPGICWDRLLFCAKEAVYKAWYPLTHTWLSFEDASVTFDAAARTFTARILKQDRDGTDDTGRPSRAPDVFAGRWLAGQDLLITSVVVP